MSSWSVRARTTASAVAIVGSALLVAAVALVLIVQDAAERNVRSAARVRALDFVALLESGTTPSDLDIRLEEDVFVQVVEDDGEVRASSPTLVGAERVATLGDGQTAIVENVGSARGAFLIVGEEAEAEGGEYEVLVGRSLGTVQETIRVVVVALVVALPLLLSIIGIATWEQVGRALAPVESIREEVAAISGSELHRRVPDPPGDDEIARLARTMNHMLDRLETAHKQQQRFVSDASHEFRNPLAAIRQHTETALAHPEGSSASDLARDVLPESLRLQRIAEDLLTLARADEEGLRTTPVAVDVDDIVLEEAARLKAMTALKIDTKGVSAARTQGDRSQLQRLVRNLAENASRYAASTVGFAVREVEGSVVVRVDDDGPGVPEEHREEIFERFGRLDPARGRDSGGAGLGLAIVAEIAAAHGGSARVLEAELGGACFEITLPAGAS